MKKIKSDEKGFTLIEVIVTLILVGITAVLAGMWIVSVANGYLFAQMSMNTLQNGELARARLIKELMGLSSVTSGTGGQINYTRLDDSNGSAVPVTVSLNGTALQLNVNNAGNNTLADNVSTFSLTYCDSTTSTPATTWSNTTRIINISLTITGANNTPSTFIWSVAPRNL